MQNSEIKQINNRDSYGSAIVANVNRQKPAMDGTFVDKPALNYAPRYRRDMECLHVGYLLETKNRVIKSLFKLPAISFNKFIIYRISSRRV